MNGLLSRADAAALLADRLTTLADRHRVCGAQLAIHHDGETVAVEVGELEHHGDRRVTRDAAFPIGSGTKSFTATLAMILVADGDLELDAPVRARLPELAHLAHLDDPDEPDEPDEPGDRLTLRQLLSHTGGLACEPDPADLAAGSARRYVADHCRGHAFVLPPGEGFSYSNLGYTVVGRLIETVTGMSWAEAMDAILLRPLGIAPVFIHPADLPAPAPVRPTATGHSVNLALGRTQPVRQAITPATAPAGALAVSAMDLVALGRLHVAPGMPDLLPPAQAEQMRRAVPAAEPFGLADGWGLGLATFHGQPTDWAGHDGNADGTACYLRVDPAGGWVVALTTNTNTGMDLWRELLTVLSDAGIPIPAATYEAATYEDAAVAAGRRDPRSTAADPSLDYAGTYANGAAEYVIGRSDGGWSLTADGADFVLVTGADGLTFALIDRASGQRLPGGRFRRDPRTGAIDGAMVNGRMTSRRGSRGRSPSPSRSR